MVGLGLETSFFFNALEPTLIIFVCVFSFFSPETSFFDNSRTRSLFLLDNIRSFFSLSFLQITIISNHHSVICVESVVFVVVSEVDSLF